MPLDIRWTDASGVHQLGKAMRGLSARQFGVMGNRALNHTGNKARTQVRRHLTKQTGISRGVIVRAVKVTPSNVATLRYRMEASGGEVALKHFKPRETRRGVSAAPFGQRRVFEGSFLKGGRFPNRKPISGFSDHVMERAGDGRFPVRVVKSGVVIPAEMVKGQTATAFRQTVDRELPRRLEHELRRLGGGVLS